VVVVGLAIAGGRRRVGAAAAAGPLVLLVPALVAWARGRRLKGIALHRREAAGGAVAGDRVDSVA